MDQAGLPGAVLLVAQQEDVIFNKAYGYAQKYAFGRESLEHPEPMTTDYRFDLASPTKVLATTFGIMVLVDEGVISVTEYPCTARAIA